MTYTDWCELNNVSHGHCPHGCEHPQPFWADGVGLICGRCWFVEEKTISLMIPCEC